MGFWSRVTGSGAGGEGWEELAEGGAASLPSGVPASLASYPLGRGFAHFFWGVLFSPLSSVLQ